MSPPIRAAGNNYESARRVVRLLERSGVRRLARVFTG
jgi:hypothetical protein